MLKRGFTLIELLIVITIVAILAGAAVPFVQDYVEDARLAKVRADLDEIKNALARYELDTGKIWTSAEVGDLVGPYLAKAMFDPWGSPYVVNDASSTVYSSGPDRSAGGTDDIAVDFRPPMALSKVYYIDANNDGSVGNLDQLKLRFTREVSSSGVATISLNTDPAGMDAIGTYSYSSDRRDVLFKFTDIKSVKFIPGSDMLVASCTDKGAFDCNNNQVLIKAF